MGLRKRNNTSYKKGNIPWIKGKRHSEKTKEKLKKANLGKCHSKKTKKKMSEVAEGHKVLEKTRKKIGIANSKANKGRIPWNAGKHRSDKTKNKIGKTLKGKYGGKNSPSWQGGITPENLKIRNSIEYRLWRESVFARDNWTCQKYFKRGGELEAHHIKNFAQYPELRFAIDNGITFSEKAHKEFHKIYGQTKNTKKQLEGFLRRR